MPNNPKGQDHDPKETDSYRKQTQMTNTTSRPPTRFRAIFSWHSLKTKVTIFTLGIFLISILSMAIYSSYKPHNDMERALGEQQFSTVSIIAAEINAGLEDRIKSLEKVAALITPAMLGNAPAMQRFIEGRLILQMMFNGGYFVLLPDGTAIADFPLSTGRRGLNFMDRKYASGALQEGKATIGNPVMGKALRSMLFSIAVPIHNAKGKVIGALAGTVDLAKPNFISRITDNTYGKTGGYLLIEPKVRTIIFATDKKRILEVLPAPGINSLIDRFIQGYEGSGITIRPSDGVETLSSAKGIPVSGWYMVALMPTEEVFAPIRYMVWQIILVAIFLTMLLGGLTWWMLKRQLEPVFTTIKTLTTLSNTDQHPEPLPISRQDEIGELIGGFNHLLGTLGQREEALKESEERFRKIANAGWEGLVFHKDGVLLDGNNSFLKMFGYSAEEIIGKSVFDFLAPESIDLAVQKLKQYSSGGQSYFEGKGLKKDNTIFPIEFMGRPIKYKDFDARVLSIRDITERKRTEETLRESEEHYRSLVEGIPCIVYTFSQKLGGVYYSSQVANILGYSPEQLCAQPLLWHNSIHPEDLSPIEQVIRETARGKSFCVEYRIRDAHGDWRWLEDRSFGYKVENADTIIEGLAFDITDRKRAEAERISMGKQLLQSQKMEAIGTLAGGIAHDFNNILSIIIGYMELAMDRDQKENQISYLRETLAGAERAKNLVKQILTFSKQDDSENKPLDVKIMLKEAIKFLRSSIPTTIEISQHITSESCNIMADSTQMHRVIMNLCTNASHAMKETGGTLNIELTTLKLTKGDLPNHPKLRPGQYVKLTIRDTGYGIDPDNIHRIFDPFFTTKSVGEGTGLGLSVVYGIVKRYGGMINVYSEQGKGAVFHVYLPRIIQAEAMKVDTNKPAIGGTERILFVDDEPSLVDIGTRMLSSIGYVVTGVLSSVDALNIFRAEPDRFDLVITDMTLPKMTGMDLSRKLLQIRPDIPIIICSGINDPETEVQVKSLGIKSFLQKPLTRRELSQTIRNTIDGDGKHLSEDVS